MVLFAKVDLFKTLLNSVNLAPTVSTLELGVFLTTEDRFLEEEKGGLGERAGEGERERGRGGTGEVGEGVVLLLLLVVVVVVV